MSISPFIIYLWGSVDGIKTGILVAAALLTGITAIITIVYLSDEDKETQSFDIGKQLRRLLPPTAIMWILGILIPSSKTIAMMIIIPAIINSEPIQKDLPELYRMGMESLKEQLSNKK